MTEFQRKRLVYFIKSAKEYGWVRLAPGDLDILEAIKFQSIAKEAFEKHKDAFERLEDNKPPEDEL